MDLSRFLFLLLALVLAGGPLRTEPITIASWNIANLHHEEGFHLRAFSETFHSVARDTADFALLAAYRDRIALGSRPADIIALQEIGTRAALERLFPNALYETMISPRWRDDDMPEGEGDVFTAIAVRRDAGIRVIARSDLPELGILHTDGHETRAGTGALIEARGQLFWFLSVHLKSSCRGVKSIETSINDNCQTLWRQAGILRSWIEEKQASGHPFIIAGDFNRDLRRLAGADPFWKALNGVAPMQVLRAPEMVKYPIFADRTCPTRRGTSTQPIDWFLIERNLARHVLLGTFLETHFSEEDMASSRGGRGLSDHCPISLQLAID